MGIIEEANELRGGKKLAAAVIFCVICVAINYIGSQIAQATGLPLYFDCLGIILAGMFGGYIPGIAVGYITNLITSTSDPSSVYWCLTSVLIALAAAFFSKRGWFEKPHTIALSILVLALIGGGIGSVISWLLNDAFGGGTLEDFMALLGTSLMWDLVDKGITVIVAVIIKRILPSWLKNLFDFSIWQQTPLEGEKLERVRHVTTRRASLRTKIVAILAITMIIIALVTTGISSYMFFRSNAESQATMGDGIASLMSDRINANRIDDYLERGAMMPGYSETEQALEGIRNRFSDVKYVYVYKIEEDGCHVVFDLDSPDGEEGQKPGYVEEFDPSFEKYLPDLLAGKPVDPIVSNDSYGWLLTIYKPLYNNAGECTAYIGIDISMERLVQDGFAFLARVFILFAAFFILICAIAIWLAEYGLIMPVNSIARVSSNFAFRSEEEREANVEHLRGLDVKTGDEVENLYKAVTKTTEDTMQYIADAQEKAETIERMQDNLIMVMADLVESRDQHTGDHVRKTAAYTKVIMDEMRREGIYDDVLTDEFVENVVKSAPLHDVGKIEVSDVILNKPGRLTDEEFKIMQHHTIAGQHILEDAAGAMSDPGYLEEAQRLAGYHHEKWNGSGYPYGLSGEDIPLSARIMAVADVFDALVSKRSYKDGMPIDKALSIIEKDAGSHFDPQVATAFLHAEDKARSIAEEHGDASGTAGDIRDASDSAKEADAGKPNNDEDGGSKEGVDSGTTTGADASATGKADGDGASMK